ncbi:MAG: SRPBCC domain-containing protein [Balneolaceae bacterium]
MSRSIIKEVTISQSADATFDTLITPSLIKKWWLASGLVIIPQNDGLTMTIWNDEEDHKDYISEAKIKEYLRPERLLLTDIKYTSKKGHLPFNVDLNAEFTIQPKGEHVKLILKQTGFPEDADSDKFFKSCNTEWEKTLICLKDVAEKYSLRGPG